MKNVINLIFRKLSLNGKFVLNLKFLKDFGKVKFLLKLVFVFFFKILLRSIPFRQLESILVKN